MFENGSYLRRRKRFKLLKQEQIRFEEENRELEERIVKNRQPITKTSFLIDNLLANDTNTNTSFATSSSSSSSSETSSTMQQLLFLTDSDPIRKLTLLNGINGYHHRSSQ